MRVVLSEFFNGNEVSISAVESATDAVGQEGHHHTVILTVVAFRQILGAERGLTT